MKKFITVFSLAFMAVTVSSTAKAVSYDEVLAAKSVLYQRSDSEMTEQSWAARTILDNTSSKMMHGMWEANKTYDRAGNFPYLKQAEQVRNQYYAEIENCNIKVALGKSTNCGSLSGLTSQIKKLEDAYVRAVILDIEAERY